MIIPGSCEIPPENPKFHIFHPKMVFSCFPYQKLEFSLSPPQKWEFLPFSPKKMGISPFPTRKIGIIPFYPSKIPLQCFFWRKFHFFLFCNSLIFYLGALLEFPKFPEFQKFRPGLEFGAQIFTEFFEGTPGLGKKREKLGFSWDVRICRELGGGKKG